LSSKPENALGACGALARLYCDVAIWRRGAADVPGVPVLLWSTLALYIVVTAALSVAFGLGGRWPGELAVDVLYTLGWAWLLLRVAGRRERFMQVATALFGFQLVLAPLTVGVQALVPAPVRPGDPRLLAVQLAVLALQAWIIAAVAHIVRDAFEWPLAAGVALAIFLLMVEVLLMQALLLGEGG
jgi:hypothetical protein